MLIRCLKIIVLFSCLLSSAPTTVFSDNLHLKVGIILPMSGSLSAYGTAVRQGLQLAAKEFPTEFSQIEFIYEDSAYEGKKTVSAFQKLVSTDHINLAFVWGNTPSASIAPLAKQKKVPLVAISTDSSLNLDNKWVIAFQSTMSEFGRVLAAYLKQKKLEKIAIIKTSLPYYLSMVDQLNQFSGAELKPVFSQEVIPDEMNFKTIITKMRESNPMAIGVFLMPGQISQFYKQAAEQGLSSLSFGSEDISARTEIDAVPMQLEGAVFPGTQVTPEFSEIYIEDFQDDSHIAHAGYVYEFGRMLPAIVNRAKAAAFSNEALLNSFSTIQITPGALGEFVREVHASGSVSFTFPVVMRTIYKGHAKDL